jgi:hypothetical protein
MAATQVGGDQMQPAIGYRAQRRQQQCDHAFPDGRPVVSGPITEVQALERDLETSQARGFWTPCSKDRTNRSINDSNLARSNADRMSTSMSLRTVMRTPEFLIV